MANDLPRLSNEDYKYVYSRVPRLCVDLLIVVDGGLVLIKREIPPEIGLWHLPGGRVFYKESIDESIARIAKAETNLEVRRKKLMGYMEFPNDGEYVHSVSIIFLVELVSGSLRGSEQGREIQSFKELPDTMHATHGPFLKGIWKEIFEENKK